MKKSKNTLIVKTSTWNKESTELLDYESQDLIRANFTTKYESCIIRNSKSISLLQNIKEVDNSANILLKLTMDSSDFYANCKNYKKEDNEKENNLNDTVNWGEMSWFIVKMLKTSQGENGYRLNPGDMIKLGRVKLKICDIKLPGYDEEAKHYNNNLKNLNEKENEQEDQIKNMQKKKTASDSKKNLVNINDTIKNKKNTQTQKLTHTEKESKELNSQLNNSDRKKSMCRICYCSEKELESPLIRPCNCSGTMKYIHFCCLQKWLKSKIVIKTSSNESTITYSFKLVECELCKTLLPDFILYKNNLYEIWDFTKPTFKSYISFETVTSDRNNKILYIVNLDNKSSLKIGRGHDSDVRITDISVSRFHSLISKTKDGKLILEDNNSKFGTLALVQSPCLTILHESPLSIQVGRTIINLAVKPPCGFFKCFFKKSKNKNNHNDYQALNQLYVNRKNHNHIKVQLEEEESVYSITEHLDTQKEKENTIQKTQQDNIRKAEPKPLEESKNLDIDQNQSREIILNNYPYMTNRNNNNNIDSQIQRSRTNLNSNIIIIEKDESREIRINESEIFRSILDPNYKTERNEKEINELSDEIKKEEEEAYNLPNCLSDRRLSGKDHIQSSKGVLLNIKEDIDIKILDLKNLNLMIINNKLETIESFMKLKKNPNEKEANHNEVISGKIIRENPEGVNLDQLEENFEIKNKKQNESLILEDINLQDNNPTSERFSNMKTDKVEKYCIDLNQNSDKNNNKNILNKSDTNIENALDNENCIISHLNSNAQNIHFSDDCHYSRNRNSNKIENKKTSDMNIIMSFKPNNLINNLEENYNELNSNPSKNKNSSCDSNETDNENNYPENSDNSRNSNRENMVLTEEANGNNLVLNAVINLNEIDNFQTSDNQNFKALEKNLGIITKNIDINPYNYYEKNDPDKLKSFSANLATLQNKKIFFDNEPQPYYRKENYFLSDVMLHEIGTNKSNLIKKSNIDKENKLQIKDFSNPINNKYYQNNYENNSDSKNEENNSQENLNEIKNNSNDANDYKDNHFIKEPLSAKNRPRNLLERVREEYDNLEKTPRNVTIKRTFLEDINNEKIIISDYAYNYESNDRNIRDNEQVTNYNNYNNVNSEVEVINKKDTQIKIKSEEKVIIKDIKQISENLLEDGKIKLNNDYRSKESF